MKKYNLQYGKTFKIWISIKFGNVVLRWSKREINIRRSPKKFKSTN